MAFKVPSIPYIKPRTFDYSGLPLFSHSKFCNKEEIGRGSFGAVFSADNECGQKIVIKKMLSQDLEDRKTFIKEARILQSLRHSNIVEFKGICMNPLALVLEFMSFDFRPFGGDTCVSNLQDFISCIDTFDCENFDSPHLFKMIVKNIASGIEYLHTAGVAHRDIKPANVLVSNQHYSTKSMTEIVDAWGERPLVCKLADFGESRSSDYQTNSVLNSRTRHVNRGTPVYMAPELLVGDIQLPFANLEDLKRADMWALGMTLFVLLNPGSKYPYKREFEQPRDHRKSMIDQLEILLKNQQHPVEPLKYQHQHSTNWYTIYKIYEACTSFDARARPDVSTVLKMLDQDYKDTSINHHLRGSQASALEYHDEMVARNVQHGKHTSDIVAAPPIHNDGTNACAFLSVMIAHKIHQVAGNGRPAWPEMCEVAEKVIDELPKKINSHRNVEEHYDVIGAYSILKQAKCEIDNYEFSEEFVDPHYVFSQKGMSALKSAVLSMTRKKLAVAIYTCEPIIFLIGFTGGHIFLLDTHPVSESVGGRRKGMLKLFPATNEASVEEVCLWLWRRLHSSGVKNDSYQSFSFVNKVER